MKRIIAIVATLTVFLGLLTAAVAAAAPGSADDPLISLSYIHNTLLPRLEQTINNNITNTLMPAADSRVARFDTESKLKKKSITKEALRESAVYLAQMKLFDEGIYARAPVGKRVTLHTGERLVLGTGGTLQILGGSAKFFGETSAVLVNTASGYSAELNRGLAPRVRFITASDHIMGAEATADNTVLLVSGEYQALPAYEETYTGAAFALKELGLFLGTNKGFELEREATRLEALILFLRLIGEEKAALAYTGTHPFTDVPVWGTEDTANKYVAYAYAKGYTKGTAATRFGTTDTVTPEQYMTFVLRALTYRDGTDFAWNDSLSYAVSKGIITAKEKDMVLRRGFCRDLTVYLSFRSLSAARKGSSETLADRLIATGSVDGTTARRVLKETVLP